MDNNIPAADAELAALGYPQHILDAFSQGALLDLRVRFAMQLLTNAPIFSGMAADVRDAATADARSRLDQVERAMFLPRGIAKAALDIAQGLFDEAEARGMVKPLDYDGKLPGNLISQAKRLGAFQFYQQMGANEAAKETAPTVVPVAPGRRPLMNG